MPTFPSRSRPLSWKFSSKCCARMMLDYGPQTLTFGVVVQGDWLEVLGCGVVEQQIMINSGQGKNKAVLWSRHSSQLRNRRQDRMGIWFGTRATSNGPFRVQQTPSPQVIWRSLTVSVCSIPDIRLFWSDDQRFISQFEVSCLEYVFLYNRFYRAGRENHQVQALQVRVCVEVNLLEPKPSGLLYTASIRRFTKVSSFGV
jgi:hypothetical protein